MDDDDDDDDDSGNGETWRGGSRVDVISGEFTVFTAGAGVATVRQLLATRCARFRGVQAEGAREKGR